MPLTATFTEDMVKGIAPDAGTFEKAKQIAAANRLRNLGVSSDGTWLIGECQGSGSEPYQFSADFHDPNNPTLRSNSPSRSTPDKYSLALLLAYLNDGSAFGAREPSDDLLLKREKKIVQDEKKKSGSAAPRKISKPAADKKAAAQREGLELLERLLIDLVAGGQWFDATRIDKIEKLSKHLSDASLPATVQGLRRLMVIAKQKDLNDEEKLICGTETIGFLWTTWRKARVYLEQKLPAGETQAEADIFVEEVVGKAWQTSELRERGYFATDLSLLELAFERIDDESRQQRLEISDLLDQTSGAIHQAVTFRPFKGLSQVPDQPSYQVPITVAESPLYPGFINRRLRWEKGIEQLIENPPGNTLAKACALARSDFAATLDEYRNQLRHLLAPREAVVFLQCARIGRISEKIIIQDDEGTRIEMRDRRKDYSNVANLVRAAGMMGKDKPAVLVRLYVQPLTNTVVGLPLAAVTEQHHLRLGI
jgi:hypothetical protein